MKRGEVWLCTLDPTVGSEIRKTRPYLLVSHDALNGRLHTVIVAPLTSSVRPADFRIAVAFQGVRGLILPDQIRTLDKQRLVKRLGLVDDAALRATLAVLGEMFGE